MVPHNSTCKVRRVFSAVKDRLRIASDRMSPLGKQPIDGAARGPTTALEGDFSTWDRDYPLVLGNEATMTRSFLGRIFLVALYDRVLTQQQIQSSFRAGPLVRPTPLNNS